MAASFLVVLLLVAATPALSQSTGSPEEVEIVLEDRESSGFFLRGDSDDGQRFTVFRDPVTVRASLGPFTVRQTVTTGGPELGAHLVTPEVTRARPVLRVLFHGGGASCAAVIASGGLAGQRVAAACRPDVRDGVCLAEATLPAAWWPPMGSAKPGRARVEFVGLEEPECPTAPGGNLPQGRVLGEVLLFHPPRSDYQELEVDQLVRLLIPQTPVYPRSKVYIPVFLQPNSTYSVYVFVLKAKVKGPGVGLRILGAQVTQPARWKVTVDMNSRQTSATVTAFVKDSTVSSVLIQGDTISPQEIFTWLVEVGEDVAPEAARISWSLRYVLDSAMAEKDPEDGRLMSTLNVRKDDIQAVVAVAKSAQLVNTAVLTGRQVSQPMRVLVVHQAGQVGDVTLQASCHAADESMLKVSPSCSSVYLDGSEIRGSQNASVLAKYGSHTGRAHFVVWMPELPLALRLDDSKLSQVRGWRAPDDRKDLGNMVASHDVGGTKDGSAPCRPRYQQSRVEVYTRFFSVDHNSGREAFLLNKRSELRVTTLVGGLLRVADTRVAELGPGGVVRGRRAGRTEVQVLSPVTGRVIGARELRVAADKENIARLEAAVVSGLQLAVEPQDGGVMIAKTRLTRALGSQYQEALLAVRLHFTDGSSIALSDVPEGDYLLEVESLAPKVVASAPMAGARHPRVIAVGQGSGDLLRVSLQLTPRCQRRRSRALTTTRVSVTVSFSPVQNDAMVRDEERRSPFQQPSVQPRPAPGATEVGIYAVLAVFFLAVLASLVSCSVVAARYKHRPPPPAAPPAPDWVWLGKATLERTDLNGNHPPVGGSLGSRVPRRPHKPKAPAASRASFPEVSSSTYTKPTVPPHRHAPPVPPHAPPRRPSKAVQTEPTQSDVEWEAVTQGRDYGQLLHYFDNLKESNA